MKYYLYHLFIPSLVGGIFLKSFEFVYNEVKPPPLGTSILLDTIIVFIIALYAAKITATIVGTLWFVVSQLNRLHTENS